MALNYQLLGKTIKELRSAKKISQQTFAEMIGKSPTYVSMMERGEKGLRLETLILIADALDTSLDKLMENCTLPRPLAAALHTDKAADCTAYELFVVTESMLAILDILRQSRHLLDQDM